MRQFKTAVSLAFLFSLLLVKAQQNYQWPLKGQFPLTGNYGEIRPNHFHMGLDLSTQNRENLPVYAIADGYVSRIRISSVGYGKSVYITHADGHLSLYAHLNSFEVPLATYLKKIMTEQQVNEIDYTVPENDLMVKRGQQIGLSGNTGGSSGPHLHFEIRDTKSEIPLNPLLFFGYKDTFAPVLTGLAIYSVQDSLKEPSPIQKQIKIIKQNKDSAFVAPIECSANTIGIGFSGYDLLEKNGNENQIAKVELWFDSNLVYRHYFSQLQFDDARYVNEFADKLGAQKFQRCFLPEQYPSGLHEFASNRGRIVVADTMWHRYTLRLSDEAGNIKTSTGKLRCNTLKTATVSLCSENLIQAGSNQILQVGKFNILFPAKSLYNSTCVFAKSAVKGFTLLPSALNLHTAVKISCYDTTDLAKKRVLTNGTNYAAPSCSNDTLYWDIKGLGVWHTELDTLGPQLSAKLPKGKHAASAKSLRFLMSDKKSGIATYTLFVNDKWTQVYYDAKSSQVILNLDASVPKGNLQLKLVAKDKCGNTSQLKVNYRNL